MDLKQIVAFAKEHAAPISNGRSEVLYRCAAHLRDGLFLPCVVLASANRRVDLAINRFEEVRRESWPWPLGPARDQRRDSYRDTVKVFATGPNQISIWDIAALEPSPFAIPEERLSEVEGETAMSWTQFIGVMRDGREISFGTTYLMEFFEMPDGYIGSDITQIISHRRGDGRQFRERPFFTCYLDGL